MIVNIQIPVYADEGIDVFWEENAIITVSALKDGVEITANEEAYLSIAKQLLYFCCNNSLSCSHVHFDSFFCKDNFSGIELIIEFSSNETVLGIDLYDEDSVVVSLNVTANANDIRWHSEQQVCVEVQNGTALIRGDEKAFLALAQCCLTFVAGRKQAIRLDDTVCQWDGLPLVLQIA